jgi:hypothetical protein
MRTMFMMAGICCMLFIQCQKGDSVANVQPTDMENGMGTSIVTLPAIGVLGLGKAADAGPAEFHLSISGSGMTAMNLRWQLSAAETSVVINGIPAGTTRIFTGTIVTRAMGITHQGEDTVAIVPGQTAYVNLFLRKSGNAVVRVTVEGMDRFPVVEGCYRVDGMYRDSALSGLTFKFFDQTGSNGYILQGTKTIGKFSGIAENNSISWTLFMEILTPIVPLYFRGVFSIDATLFKGALYATPDTTKAIGTLNGKKTVCDTIVPPAVPVTRCTGLDTIVVKDCSIDPKEYALRHCRAMGMTGTLVSLLQPCDPIKGVPALIAVQCCSTATPTPSACFVDTMGGSTSCKDTLTWIKYAQSECGAQGLILGRIQFAEPCAPGRYMFVFYEACKPK